MKRAALLALALFTLCPTARADETLFRGREVDLPKSFVCNGKKTEAGRYDLEATYDKEKGTSKLTVFKATKEVCTVVGSVTHGSPLNAKKVRIFTKVNAQLKALQIDLVMPADVRDQIPDQVFLLPLADKN